MAAPSRRLALLRDHLASPEASPDPSPSPEPAAGVVRWLSSLFGGGGDDAAGGTDGPAPHVLIGAYTDGEPVVMEDGSSIRFSTGHARARPSAPTPTLPGAPYMPLPVGRHT